jgi:glycosyltransferase involved in cell wall biosynthesis
MVAYQAAEMVGGKELIKHSLESIKDHADRIIVVEGRFAENPHGGLTPNSTDRTVEIAREFTDEVYQFSDRKQSFARDAYLLGKPGDFYFVIDADEILEGQLDKDAILSGTNDVIAVRVRDYPMPYGPQLCLRVFRHVPGIHHLEGSTLLLDHLNQIMDGAHRPTIIAKDFWLRHLNWSHPGQP